jgi:small subunit ribosomal protein S17
MLRASGIQLPWWNFTTEQRVKRVVMYGGNRTDVPKNALHRIYLKRFRRNTFPNRTRVHLNVAMTGRTQQRPRRMPWPYDMSSLLFNQPTNGSDRVGYVVGTKMLKTAVVACNYLVYYPKYNQRVARTSRVFAHDEDMACVDGDLVHVRMCRKISRYKHYYIFSILEPNIEGRERLKVGLPAVAPPLFGYPNHRRIVKLNLTSSQNTKHKLATAMQEQVQDFYRYAGTTAGQMHNRPDDAATFDDANKLVAPNAPATAGSIGGGDATLGIGEGSDKVIDDRTKKGEEFWMGQEPKEKYDYKSLSKAP